MFKHNLSLKGLVGVIFTLLFILLDIVWADVSYYVNGKGDVIKVVETTLITSNEIEEIKDINSSIKKKVIQKISLKEDISSEDMALIALISEGEGTNEEYLLSSRVAKENNLTSSYDVSFGFGKYLPKGSKKISKMTFLEIKDLQKKMLKIQKRMKKERISFLKIKIKRIKKMKISKKFSNLKKKSLLKATRKSLKKAKKRILSSAVGKGQFIRKTLAELQDRCGLKNSDIFSPYNQNLLTLKLLNQIGLKKFKKGEYSIYRFQNNMAWIWASMPDTKTGRSKYHQKSMCAKKVKIALNNIQKSYKRQR